MSHAELMGRIAETDRTFSLRDGEWRGKCLICGGPLRFDARTGVGANVEHIVPRTLGGGNDLPNLGVTHPGCNAEKGRHWDRARARGWRVDGDERYASLVARLRAERTRRWRPPPGAAPSA